MTSIRFSELPGPSTIDHCYEGWRGPALIDLGEGARLRLDASRNLGWLHLYAPAGGDAFCVEPVSQMPDAFNQAGAPQTILQPREVLSAWMRLLTSR